MLGCALPWREVSLLEAKGGQPPGFYPPSLYFRHVGTKDSIILEVWQVSVI